MKNSKLYYGLSVFFVTSLLATSSGFGADVVVPSGTADKTDSAGTLKGGYSILGSKLIGKNIKNSQGDNLGEVKDIVLDSKGRVSYIAVAYGGFLGMGDKMHAVPLSAFQFKRDKGMFYDDTDLILNVTKEQLKDEKGFDANHWPDLDNETYRTNLERRYNVHRSDMK